MLLYNRSINVKVEELDTSLLKVTALLKNDEMCNGYTESFSIEVIVEKMSLKIIDLINIVVDGYSPICQKIVPKVQNIKGLTITSGYSKRVYELVGGENGCTHMAELLIETGRCIVLAFYNSYYKGATESIKSYIDAGGINCLGLTYEAQSKQH